MKARYLLGVVCAAVASTAFAQPPNPQGYVPGAPRQGGNAGPTADNQANTAAVALFSVIDADGDGVVTTRELRRVVATLKKLDLDKDGKITLDEASSTLANTAAANGPAALGGANAGHGPGGFQPAGDPRTGPNLSQFDRNGDGVLTPDEVPPQMRSMVQGSDANNNGRLDPEEIAMIQQRMNERARGQQPLPPGFRMGPRGPERIPQNP